MFKLSNKKFSAMAIAMIFVFSLVFSNVAMACEEEPQTLLSLYLQSDLIILADYESNKVIKKEEESEYGTWQEVAHNLSIVKVLKGQTDLEKVSFINYEFHENPNAPVANEGYEEEYYQHDESYVNISKIKAGERYLYFLVKNEETGGYTLSDYASAIKNVQGKTDIYEKSIGELQEISASKENQMIKLAEWLTKSIEEPETREDGISDLSQSFYGLTDNGEYKEEGVNGTVLDKTFNLYYSNVAKNLNDSQKSRISTVLYQSLQSGWFAPKVEYPHYGINGILKSINKSQAAVFGYNMLKSIEKTDLERRKTVMSFLTDVVEDEELSNIYYKLIDLDYEDDPSKVKTKEELKAEADLRATILKDFDKRFELMLGRNFKPFPAKG